MKLAPWNVISRGFAFVPRTCDEVTQGGSGWERPQNLILLLKLSFTDRSATTVLMLMEVWSQALHTDFFSALMLLLSRGCNS